IAELVQEIDWEDIFSDSTEREMLPFRRKQDDQLGLYGPKLGVGKDRALLPGGVVAGQKILFLFESMTSSRMNVEHFDKLSIPYRAVATDIVTGGMVVLEDGSLAQAMRASMSVPGAFDPARRGDQLLVDGGLVRNLPVDIVREMGAERVIAVDVGTPLRTAEEIGSALTVVEQMTSLSIVANTNQQIASLASGDVLIRPALGNDITSASFERFSDAFTIGYSAAMTMADELAELSVSEAEYARWRTAQQACVTGQPVIQFVRLDNQSRFSDEVIESLVRIRTGEPLDQEQLDLDLRQIHGLGFIRLATYSIEQEAGQTGIEIQVREDERGSNLIETGLTISGGDRGTFLNLQGGFLKTDLDERGSEFRAVVQVGDEPAVLLDVFKYLGDERRWVVNPVVRSQRRDLLAFDDDGNAQASLRIDETGAGVFFGREFDRYATLGIGVRRYTGSAKVKVGVPPGTLDYDVGEWLLEATWDRLDDLYLPSKGTRASLQYQRAEESLGADTEFEQLLINSVTSKSWGRHNALFSLRYDVTLGGEAPVYALFTGGGFLNMSGFEPNALVGSNFGVVGAGYRYEVLEGGFLPGYVGGTLEYGNAAEDRSDIFSDGILNGSVYFAYNTPIGPMYLGWGWNTERRGVIFLRLGAILGSDSISRR
ncbi:MAG: patatin-like phospholipase family protein, partial [Xanthomonadales bacterium]|nr:patatin-like phospholipase family protein [Xanthomonadales bacterium]